VPHDRDIAQGLQLGEREPKYGLDGAHGDGALSLGGVVMMSAAGTLRAAANATKCYHPHGVVQPRWWMVASAGEDDTVRLWDVIPARQK
jgi:hypothetical protein